MPDRNPTTIGITRETIQIVPFYLLFIPPFDTNHSFSQDIRSLPLLRTNWGDTPWPCVWSFLHSFKLFYYTILWPWCACGSKNALNSHKTWIIRTTYSHSVSFLKKDCHRLLWMSVCNWCLTKFAIPSTLEDCVNKLRPQNELKWDCYAPSDRVKAPFGSFQYLLDHDSQIIAAAGMPLHFWKGCCRICGSLKPYCIQVQEALDLLALSLTLDATV